MIIIDHTVVRVKQGQVDRYQ